MIRTILPVLLLLSLTLVACGGGEIGAVIGPGDVQVRDADGLRPATGAVPLPDGASLVAAAESAARITCGGRLSEQSSPIDDPLRAGIAHVLLDPGTELKRREGSAFDLVSGSLHLSTGPVTSRIVVFRGTTFLEVPTTNADGVDLRVSTDGDALTVAVEKGEVLLHATGATQKELHYVTLGPGESATAAPGGKPEKHEPASGE